MALDPPDLADFVATNGIDPTRAYNLSKEVADVIVFLASPESKWIKGQDIAVDGGMRHSI